MFHFSEKPSAMPSPGPEAGAVTPGQAVDSSAITSAPGQRSAMMEFISCRNAIASRFSRPPWMLGTHSPALRL